MITWYRFLDWLQSLWNRSRKTVYNRIKWGSEWRDSVRSGRRYSRVECRESDVTWDRYYAIRPCPGWEWTCSNCKTKSIVNASLVAFYTIDGTTCRDDVLEKWRELAASTAARGFKPPVKPTPATAGCPNCQYRPGAPE